MKLNLNLNVNLKRAAFAVLFICAASALAHELPANRATLILRDGPHLSLTLFINYPQALHQALAPQQPLSAFVLPYSSMSTPELAQILLGVHAKFEADTRLVLANGHTAPVTHWRWPAVAQIQQQLQQRAMQMLVAPGTHPEDEEPLEIRAEVSGQSRAALAKLKLRLPAAFQDVLVVSYAPKQVWVKPQTLSPEIRF